MRSYNKVIMIGHLAADPELRQTKNKKSVANFPIAVNRNRMNDEGEKQEVADFWQVVAWNGLARTVEKFLKKGSAIQLEGRILKDAFEDSEGNKQYRTEIVMDNLIMLTSRKKGAVSVEAPEVEKEVVAA